MAQSESGIATLVKPSDSNRTVANPDDDVRGRKVIDRNGEELGAVDDLMIDDRELKVRFLWVASGGFAGRAITSNRLAGHQVRVSGTVHVFNLAAFEDQLKIDLDDSSPQPLLAAPVLLGYRCCDFNSLGPWLQLRRSRRRLPS